jgi:hypothetical protein
VLVQDGSLEEENMLLTPYKTSCFMKTPLHT